MSSKATSWVWNDALDLPPALLPVLLALAEHAHNDGRNAWPAVSTLARMARKSERQVQRNLRELEAFGFIRRGDQRIVGHLPADKRPTVYDLAMESGVTSTAPRGSSGVTSRVERGDIQGPDGVTPTSPEPKEEPKDEEEKHSSAPPSETFSDPEPEPKNVARELALAYVNGMRETHKTSVSFGAAFRVVQAQLDAGMPQIRLLRLLSLLVKEGRPLSGNTLLIVANDTRMPRGSTTSGGTPHYTEANTLEGARFTDWSTTGQRVAQAMAVAEKFAREEGYLPEQRPASDQLQFAI